MAKKTILSLVSTVVLILIALGVFTAFNKRYVEYKEPNLTAEEKKIYEDRIKAGQQGLAALKDKNDADSLNQKFGFNMELGHNYFGLGRYKEARDYYLAASKLKPDRDVAWAALFYVENARGDYKAAETDIKKAISFYPNNPDYWKWYIDLKRGKLRASNEEIDKIFNEAFFKTNSHIDIVTAYAGFLESKGDLQGALNYWKQALGQSPKNEQYKAEVARLEALVK